MMPKRKTADLEPSFDQPQNTSVQVKTEESSPDYSQNVKKKLSTSSRTGTACDRCRVRKMRCDDRPYGCIPCHHAQSECKTTDRVTGKSFVRGYVESLERRLQELKESNHELQSRLVLSGGQSQSQERSVDNAKEASQQFYPESHVVDPNVNGTTKCKPNNEYVAAAGNNILPFSQVEDGDCIRLPQFRGGLSGNNYLGVSTGNSLLSSIRGTSMNVLGVEIDLADYMSADLDEPDPSQIGHQPVYNKSYRAFVQTAFGANPRIRKVELPPRSQGFNYAWVFFRCVNPYLPVVHQPSFINTLTRTYDDPDFKPSTAKTVMLHTMLAIMYCQYAARAPQNPGHQANLTQSSNLHYHYALGFFPQLMASHTLEDVQALTLLCLHIRNTPKPGACWMLVSITLNLAIELGLHRSARNWAPTTEQISALEMEIRKRVFWSLLVIHVIVAGNLGRPMPLNAGDWDVEMPEAINDEALTEDGIDRSFSGKCNFLVGVQAMKIVPIQIDLYNSIYAVKRSPQRYEESVLNLEQRIREFSDQFPRGLAKESDTGNELRRVQLQYLEIWPLHMRLLLRHPSLSLTTSPSFNAENLVVCMEVSKKMLGHVKELQKFTSLDGTWQAGALYVLALSTTLFGNWELRDQITPSSLAALREDMDSWLSIIGDVGNLLGSGRRLQDIVRATINNTLRLLSDHLHSKTVAPRYDIHETMPRGQVVPQVNNDFTNADRFSSYNHPSNGHSRIVPASTLQPTHTASPDRMSQLASTVSTQTPQYPYHKSYTSNDSYSPVSHSCMSSLPAAVATASAYQNNYSDTRQSAPYAETTVYPLVNSNYPNEGSPSSWRDFTGSMASNQQSGSDYMSSASVLMQMGSQSAPDGTQQKSMSGTAAQMWPLTIFDPGTDAG